MSGALAQVPLSAEGIDPWAGFKNYYGAAAAQYAPAQAQANVGKTTAETGLIGAQIPETQARAGLYGAQTGLVGEQTTGQGLQNLQTSLMLDLKNRYATRFQQGQQTSTSYPDQQGPVEAPKDFPIGPLDQPRGPGIGANSKTPPVPPVEPPAEPGGGGDQKSALTEGWATNGPVRPQIGLYGTESEPVQLAPPPGPVQSQPLPPPAIGGAPAGGPAPAIGGAGGARPAPGGGAAASTLTTGPGGEIVPGVGAVPWTMSYQMQMAIRSGQDPMKVQQQMMADKKELIGRLVAQTVIPGSNPPRYDPQLWNAAVRRGYDDGLLDSAQEAQFYGHWERAPQLQSQSLDADKQLQVIQQSAAARTGGEKQGAAPFEIKEIKFTDPKTGQTSTIQGFQSVTGDIYDVNGKFMAPGSSAINGGGAGGGAGGGPGGATAPAGPDMPAQDFVNRSMQHEGGAGTGARPNQSGVGGTPTSTAGGGQQFVNGTWVDQMRETYPAWAQKYSDAQLLALKSNDQVANQLTMDYANHNAPILGAAGLPATAANLRLAHALGPQGAVSVLRANPNTPLSQVLSPKAMDANPTWAKQTAGQKVQEIRGQMGDGADLPVTGVAGGVQPNAATTLSGAGVGKPELSPTAAADLEVEKNRQQAENTARAHELEGEATAYGDESKAIIKAGFDTSTKMQRLDILQNAALAFRPGASAGARAAAMTKMVDLIQTFGGKAPDWMVKGGTGAEVIGKEGGFLGFEMARFLGSREAASVVQQAMSIQPNLKLTEGGFQALINSIREGVTRDRDLNTYREQWVSDPAHHNSIKGMIDQFNVAHPVEAYASRVMPYPWPKTAADAKPNVIYMTSPGSKMRADGYSKAWFNGQQMVGMK